MAETMFLPDDLAIALVQTAVKDAIDNLSQFRYLSGKKETRRTKDVEISLPGLTLSQLLRVHNAALDAARSHQGSYFVSKVRYQDDILTFTVSPHNIRSRARP